MKKKKSIPSRTYRIAVIIWTAIAIYAYHLSKNYYFPAPFDTPSNRTVTLLLSSSQTPENTPQIEREDMIYSVVYSLHVSIDGILNPNQSENVCILPEVTGQLRPHVLMRAQQLTNLTLFPEQLLRRGEIRVDNRVMRFVLLDIDWSLHFVSGAWNAVYRCFNVSNLPVGTHTLTFESSLETGESYSLWWQILIEQ